MADRGGKKSRRRLGGAGGQELWQGRGVIFR